MNKQGEFPETTLQTKKARVAGLGQFLKVYVLFVKMLAPLSKEC